MLHHFSYLGGEHPLQPLKVVTLLVVILHLQPVDSVAVVQGPKDDLAHVVRPFLRIYYNSGVESVSPILAVNISAKSESSVSRTLYLFPSILQILDKCETL